MRIFHINGEQFTELEDLPEQLPASGYLWLGSARREFEVGAAGLQAAFTRWTGSPLVDLHIADLLNNQLPSHFDYTSGYDMLVFRRLAAGARTASMFIDDNTGTLGTARQALEAIDTSPVGFAVFDRFLLTVHPTDCQVREFFIGRLAHQVGATSGEARSAVRLPTSPADLMLRMVNHMVDSYLELRRLLTRQFGHLQSELFKPNTNLRNWQLLLESRTALHLLEDTCEDQRSSIVEWIDALQEWPDAPDAAAQRERELLRLRSRDVLEHIERVLQHVRRLEHSAETAVQMHFAAQGHRTNGIMRVLTVMTVIFLPLNFVTGFFGMNFEGLPLIHNARGFWFAFSVMLLAGVTMAYYFWRKNLLSSEE